MTAQLERLLEQVAARHARLCPRQVLGVRMGLYAGELLQVDVPRQADKRLLAFVETDGCFVDGISVATGCWVGRRTLRVLDFGKVAAVFVDTTTERAIRLRPHPLARERAVSACPGAPDRWHAYLEGYRTLSAAALLQWQPVRLSMPLVNIVGDPAARTVCTRCSEEIINGRELMIGGKAMCASCAGDAYYVGDTEQSIVKID